MIKRDLTVCRACNQRKPIVEMVTFKGKSAGICKLCRSAHDRARKYSAQETVPKYENLYQVNMGALLQASAGIYLVYCVSTKTTNDFLILDNETVILRMPHSDVVSSYVIPEVAEMLTRRNRQLLTTKATRIPGIGGVGWVSADQILAEYYAKIATRDNSSPLATLDNELDELF